MTDSLSLLFISDTNFNDKRDLVDADFSRTALEAIKPVLREADLRIANLENPLASVSNQKPIEKVGPHQTGLPKNVAFFKEMDVDCAILANNHMGDMGPDACMETISTLEAEQIGHCGAGINTDAAYEPWITEKNGLRVAVIAVCENEFGTSSAEHPGSAGYDVDRLYRAIRGVRSDVDFLFVVYHGGNEYNPLPSPGVIKRFRLFCDFGADGVIGMHTHCPQPFELYHGKPIVYSEGNFFFSYKPGPVNPVMWHTGYMSRITIRRGALPELEIIPTQFNPQSTKVAPLAEPAKQALLDYLDRLAEVIRDPERHARLYKAWCEMDGKAKGYFLDPEFWGETYNREMLLRMKNRFCCEAFHEILKTSIAMLMNHEFPVPEAWHEELSNLRQLPQECAESLKRMENENEE